MATQRLPRPLWTGTSTPAEDLEALFRRYDIPYKAVRQQIGKGGDELLPEFLSKEEIEEVGKELKQYRSNFYDIQLMKTLLLLEPRPNRHEILRQ